MHVIGAQINQQLSLVVLTFNINEISRVLECNKRKIIIVFTRAKTRKRGNLAVVKYFWCLGVLRLVHRRNNMDMMDGMALPL